jgi:hypothetical protein
MPMRSASGLYDKVKVCCWIPERSSTSATVANALACAALVLITALKWTGLVNPIPQVPSPGAVFPKSKWRNGPSVGNLIYFTELRIAIRGYPLQCCPENSSPFVFSDGRSDLALLTPEGHTWSQSVGREYCSPAYGKRTGASVITFGAHAQLPADFVTLVLAGEQGELDLGQFTTMNGSAPAKTCGYRYRNSRQEHAFFFAPHHGGWKLDAWGSDAEFLWWRLDRTKEQYTLVLCNGSYVDAGGHRVLTCGKTVSYAEVVSSAGKVELFSSDREGIVLEESLDRMWAERELTAPDGNRKRMGL